jgi:glucosamine kinase
LDAAQRARAAALPFRVGVDGGGTGTRARLQDAGGRTLGQGSAGPSGLSQGVDQAWRHVQQAIAAAFNEAGLTVPEPSTVVLGLGLAGAEVAALHAAFLAGKPDYALALLENDGITQLAGAHAGRPGIVVSAGTGAVAAAKYADGRVRRCGGWGWPAGDEGAGSWLGLQAVRALQQVLDGRSSPGPLSAAIADAIRPAAAASSTAPTAPPATPTAAAVQAWSAQAGASACAQLAPLVFAAAAQGDAQAEALLQTAAAELARLADALSAPAACDADLPVVLNGSVGTRLSPRWPQPLRSRLVSPAGDSADGALLLLRLALAAT